MISEESNNLFWAILGSLRMLLISEGESEMVNSFCNYAIFPFSRRKVMRLMDHESFDWNQDADAFVVRTMFWIINTRSLFLMA